MPEDRPVPVPPPTPDPSRTPLQPMPRGVIAVVAALIAAATTGLVVALWWAGTAGLSGASLVTARFDALRTGLGVGIGAGGVFALYLAWRRQHATEIGLVQKERDQADVARAYELQRETAEHTRLHAERVAVTTERDAEARRITDLYAKSVEQLGSDKAPVRHGGLYALERLAQDNPGLRQTVVSVLCSYLRAPFDLPGDPPDDTDRAARDEHRGQVQEREVRATAQRVLATHLNPGNGADDPATTFWEDIDLDLSAAVLVDWDTTGCRVRNAIFHRTAFIGEARFSEAVFTGNARFTGATFSGNAHFDRATFAKVAWLNDVTITGDAWFADATFTGDAWFTDATITGDAWFTDATFTGRGWFSDVTFTGNAWFRRASFLAEAHFIGVTFAGNTWFDRAKFADDTWFTHATFNSAAFFHAATFTADVWFQRATSRHFPPGSPPDRSGWPAGWRPSAEHAAIEGRDGTWHRLLQVPPAPRHPGDPTTEPADD